MKLPALHPWLWGILAAYNLLFRLPLDLWRHEWILVILDAALGLGALWLFLRERRLRRAAR